MDNEEKYIENLETLDFLIENRENSSVYLVNKLEEYIAQQNVSPYIIFALDKAKTFDADAVYFRFFDDNRPQQAQLYIYDNIVKKRSPDYYAQKHKEIWSGCEVASFLIIDDTTIKIYDSRNPVKIDNDNLISKPIETINLLNKANNVIRQYSAQNFNNGSFWENKITTNLFLNSKIASERLIKGLREIRNNLHKRKSLNADLIDRLLIICILIKYF
jgi:hypothetical protein